MSHTESILEERGKRYGKFCDNARTSQQLKGTIICSPNWTRLSDSQKESLDMIAHKIGRILNGDPDYDDNWVDIAGYATLIVQELNKK